jgi:carbon catabolite-derepressing protein kinase
MVIEYAGKELFDYIVKNGKVHPHATFQLHILTLW